MVARSPALSSLGLAAFLRSLLPAQPAPCPHGAGARAAFRKPSCISLARRLRGGPLGRAWASGPHRAVGGRSSERLLSLRRWLQGSAARGPQVGPGDPEQTAWEAGAAGDPRLTPKSEQPGSQGAGGERGWGAGLGASRSPDSGEQVGRGAARSAQRPHAYPGPAPAEQPEDTRVRLPAQVPSREGPRGARHGRVGSQVQTFPRHQPGRPGDPEDLPRAAASRRRAFAPPASTQGGLAL